MLVNKTILLAAISTITALPIMLVSLVISWIFLGSILLPPLSVLVNLFISFWLVLGVFGLIGVFLWMYPRSPILSILMILGFVVMVCVVSILSWVLTYSILFTIFFMILAVIVILLFYLLVNRVSKEKIVLARL